METTKITVRIQSGLLTRFDEDIKRCFIKRDAFLNQIIGNEVPHLRRELTGKRCSPMAHQYISRSLMRLETKPVNITVEKSVAHALNEVVKEANVVRDAFANYLLLALRSTDLFLKHFELPTNYSGSHFDSVLEPTPVSPLKAIAHAMFDPFYYLRTAVEERYETGLYGLELPKDFHAFCCYLPDEAVPGTEANKQQIEFGEQLLASLRLDALEQAAFGQQKGASK